MLKIKLSDQTVIKIKSDSLVRFYKAEVAEGFKLKLAYENSIDNSMKERVSYHSGSATVSGEISRLALNSKHQYEGLAAALKQYDYFSLDQGNVLMNTTSIVNIEEVLEND